MSAFTRSQPAPIHRPAFTCTDVGGVHAGGGGTAPEAARGPANDWPQFGQNCWSDRTWVPQRSQNMKESPYQDIRQETARGSRRVRDKVTGARGAGSRVHPFA